MSASSQYYSQELSVPSTPPTPELTPEYYSPTIFIDEDLGDSVAYGYYPVISGIREVDAIILSYVRNDLLMDLIELIGDKSITPITIPDEVWYHKLNWAIVEAIVPRPQVASLWYATIVPIISPDVQGLSYYEVWLACVSPSTMRNLLERRGHMWLMDYIQTKLLLAYKRMTRVGDNESPNPALDYPVARFILDWLTYAVGYMTPDVAIAALYTALDTGYVALAQAALDILAAINGWARALVAKHTVDGRPTHLHNDGGPVTTAMGIFSYNLVNDVIEKILEPIGRNGNGRRRPYSPNDDRRMAQVLALIVQRAQHDVALASVMSGQTSFYTHRTVRDYVDDPLAGAAIVGIHTLKVVHNFYSEILHDAHIRGTMCLRRALLGPLRRRDNYTAIEWLAHTYWSTFSRSPDWLRNTLLCAYADTVTTPLESRAFLKTFAHVDLLGLAFESASHLSADELLEYTPHLDPMRDTARILLLCHALMSWDSTVYNVDDPNETAEELVHRMRLDYEDVIDAIDQDTSYVARTRKEEGVISLDASQLLQWPVIAAVMLRVDPTVAIRLLRRMDELVRESRRGDGKNHIWQWEDYRPTRPMKVVWNSSPMLGLISAAIGYPDQPGRNGVSTVLRLVNSISPISSQGVPELVLLGLAAGHPIHNLTVLVNSLYGHTKSSEDTIPLGSMKRPLAFATRLTEVWELAQQTLIWGSGGDCRPTERGGYHADTVTAFDTCLNLTRAMVNEPHTLRLERVDMLQLNQACTRALDRLRVIKSSDSTS